MRIFIDIYTNDTNLDSRQILESSAIRLDECVANVLDSSRNQTLNLIRDKCIFLNNKVCKKGGIYLKDNDSIRIHIPPIKPPQECKPNDISIDILYEDEAVLILNKPPLLVVHSAPSVKEATLADWLKAKNFTLSTLNGENRPGIIHRLDKETSGAIAIAKTNYTHTFLSEQLKSKQMGRYYLAIIDSPLKERKIVESYIARHPKHRLKMANIDKMGLNLANARYAKSEFVPLLESKISPKLQLIVAKLYTGRTHQIRTHLESLHKHILGDELYGYKATHHCRIMLHAYILHFIHPLSKKEQMFCAPIFRDMLQFCLQAFDKKDFNEAIQIDSILGHFS